MTTTSGEAIAYLYTHKTVQMNPILRAANNRWHESRNGDGRCPDEDSPDYRRGFSDGLKEAPECQCYSADATCAARGSTQAAPAPVAEDAEIRKALNDAAASLETISRIAGKDQYMLEMMDVRLYAAARAKVAREVQAAQPEGGAK